MLQYYTSLYASDPIDKNIAQKFLDKLYLPTVTPAQLGTLNADISMSEISTIIRHLAPAKNSTKNSRAFPLQCFTGMWSGGPYASKSSRHQTTLKKGKKSPRAGLL